MAISFLIRQRRKVVAGEKSVADFSDALPLSYPDSASGAGLEPATLGLRSIRCLRHRLFPGFGRTRRRLKVNRGTNATVVLSVLAIERPGPESSGRESNPLPPIREATKYPLRPPPVFSRRGRETWVKRRAGEQSGSREQRMSCSWTTRFFIAAGFAPASFAPEVSVAYATGFFLALDESLS
jgi:hypothetical protein